MGKSPCDVTKIIDALFSTSEELTRRAQAAKGGPRAGYAPVIKQCREFKAFTATLLDLDLGQTSPDKLLRYNSTRDAISLYILPTRHWEAIFTKSEKDPNPVYRAISFYYVP